MRDLQIFSYNNELLANAYLRYTQHGILKMQYNTTLLVFNN